MTTERKSRATRRRDAIDLEKGDPSDTPNDAIARTLTRPEMHAARTMQMWEGGDRHEVSALMREMAEQIAAANRGDLSRTEGMLVAQAHTLDALFNNLACRAHVNLGAGYLEAGERFMRLALKAQSQCRTTHETLAEIKNPMAGAYVRQANIAAGHQQINNGIPATPWRAERLENLQNKLSGGSNGLLQNTRASKAQGCIDLPVDAVEEIDRAKIAGG